MSKSSEHSVYVFDGFRLDGPKRMLYRGETEVALPPKAIETLAVLAANCGEIISKDELIGAVWKDAFVEDSNLSHYLYLLRKSLGPRSDGKPYIETLRKRGYRFDPEKLTLENERNDREAIAIPAPAARNFHVERRGNVLALVDWPEPDAAAAEARPAAEAPRRSDQQWRPLQMAIGLVAVSIVVAVSTVFYLSRSGVLEGQNAASEQYILPLTNGIEIMAATISPDGKYFVYVEPEGKLNRLLIQQTGQSTRHEIVKASERIPIVTTFTPDSQYIYFVAVDAVGEPGSLYRVATLGGPVTKIMSEMQTGVSFSPDGREMVYYRFDKGGARFVVNASDGGGEERFLHGTTPGFGSSAWSPDGKWIAVVLQAKQEDYSAGCRVAAVKVDTGSLVEFSDEIWDGCARIEWAPDGRGLFMIATRAGEAMTPRRDQIFYISYPQGKSRKITAEGNRYQGSSLGVTRDGSVLAVPFNRSSQIWAMDPNGDSRTATQLTTGQADGRTGVAPLADGSIAYISRTGENLNVWVMDPGGSNQKQITNNSHAIEELRSGGDGRYLVFSSYLNPPRSHLFRMNADGTQLRQITFGEGQEVDSSMSHDGKWITYDSTIPRADKPEYSLWKQPIDGGERVSLNRSDCQMPHFSPDDKYISCVRDQKDVLILSSADGTLISTIRVPPAVTLSNSINFGARWTPDGKAVVYNVNEKGVSNIWTHPIDGGPAKRLTDFTGGSIYHFAYSMDGKRLFVARGYQIRDAVLISDSKN